MTNQEFNEKSLLYCFNKVMSETLISSKYISVTFPLILADDASNPRVYISTLLEKVYPNKNYIMLEGYFNNTSDGISRCSGIFTTSGHNELVTSDNALVNLIRTQFTKRVIEGIKEGNIIYNRDLGALNVNNVGSNLSWSIEAPNKNANTMYKVIQEHLQRENLSLVDTGLMFNLTIGALDNHSSIIRVFIHERKLTTIS